MRQLTFLIGLFSAVSGFSQDTMRQYFSATYSNNTQISDVVHELYFKEKDEPNVKQSVFKINLSYSLQSKLGCEYGLQLGYGQRNDIYPRVDSKLKSARQQYYTITPFVLKTWEFKRLNVSTGAGIPLNIVSEYRYRGYDYMQKPFSTIIDGGFSIGLNSITQLHFYLTERLALTSAVQFGGLYVQLGGKFEQKPDDPDYNPIWLTDDNRKSKQMIFTQPEFFAGLAFRL